jgi:hypothetical protein
MDWPLTLRQIEDDLCPKLQLDAWEKSLYYHVLRLTHGAGSESAWVAIEPLARATRMSDHRVRKSIRSLNAKNCILIRQRSRIGHSIVVRLPEQIDGVVSVPVVAAPIDVETIDFYKDRKFRTALLKREGYRCFYTLKSVTEESAVLDHVVPEVDGGGNSYRNIVVACHDVNALKQDDVAEDFIRSVFRTGILSASEMQDRLQAVEALKAGKLRPELS